MARPLILESTPHSLWQWTSAFLVWLYFNVFLGGLAIIVSLVAWWLFDSPHPVPNEATEGLIILGIAIAASGANLPTSLQEFCHEDARTLLPIGSHFIALGGTIAAVLIAFSPYFIRIGIEPRTSVILSFMIVAFGALVGAVGFVVKVRASDRYVVNAIRRSRAEGEYAPSAEAEARRLADEASKTDDFGGVKV